jgi:hypothetical protein
MTGMGSLLATVLLAVPLIIWLSGIILLTDSQWKLARSGHAPRGCFPTSRKSNSPAIASRPYSKRAARAVDEVSR